MGASDLPDGGPGPYGRTPFNIWHPSVSEERGLALSTSWLRYPYVASQLLWILLTLPAWVILVLLRFPDIPSRPSWTLKQRLVIPLMNRVLWALDLIGTPPDESFSAARKDPSSMEKSYGRPTGDDKNHGVTVEQLDLPIPDEERLSRWFLPAEAGGVLDPTGIVRPERVPCYSYWREPLENGGTGFSLARPGETAILYLFGGGYTQRHPLERAAFELCRKTGFRLIAPNYRKATSPGRAFPAALQDAMLTYAHLVDKLHFEKIVLFGNSSGGGLCLALMLALARLPEAKLRAALTPTHVIINSPVCDLMNFDTPSCLSEQDVDIISIGKMHEMSFAYGQNLLKNPLPAHSLATQSPWHPTQLRRHPFLSPSLPHSVPWFAQSLKSARFGGPKVFLTWGAAELMRDHCQELRKRLLEAGWREDGEKGKLVCIEGEDETHCWNIYPAGLSQAVKEYWPKVNAFLNS